jgi:hypothetical protein
LIAVRVSGWSARKRAAVDASAPVSETNWSTSLDPEWLTGRTGWMAEEEDEEEEEDDAGFDGDGELPLLSSMGDCTHMGDSGCEPPHISHSWTLAGFLNVQSGHVQQSSVGTGAGAGVGAGAGARSYIGCNCWCWWCCWYGWCGGYPPGGCIPPPPPYWS